MRSDERKAPVDYKGRRVIAAGLISDIRLQRRRAAAARRRPAQIAAAGLIVAIAVWHFGGGRVAAWGGSPAVSAALGTPAAPANCHPSYHGACLPLHAADVDCAGGGGSGPVFVRGPLKVVGPDVYRLDSDGDGIACE
jgi:hypothetical protein